MAKRLIACLLGSLLLAGAVCAAEAPAYKWAQCIVLPQEDHEKVFRPAEKRANFTFFAGVENVRVEGGVLKFALAGKKATLGWGNYMGQQPLADIVDMWEERNNVTIGVKQSGATSTWTLRYWIDGSRASTREVQPVVATLTGNVAADLELKGALVVPTPDGLEIEIEGQPGDQFEISYLKLVQPRHEGYIRKEFVLPAPLRVSGAGKVWRAIAEVGGVPELRFYGRNKIIHRLYINGREVKRRGAGYLYAAAPVDIAPYLRPGKNCVAFYGYRVGPAGHFPFLFLQSRIIMDNGEQITIQTDNTWKYSPTEEPGWNKPGLDDSKWSPVGVGMTPLNDPSGLGTYGYLRLKNPARKDLFYTDDSNIEVEVWVPAGLKAQAPVLNYTFSRTDAEGNSIPLKEEAISNFATKGDSLVYRINVGRHPRGVYTIAPKLQVTDGILEERPAEPLVVLRRLNLKQIEGKDYLEGLDLELEDSIDFTNPKDPHPWIEAVPGGRGQPAVAVTQPNIVKKKGLIYREAPWYFSYRFQFKHPGSFYLLEVDYPDDAWRDVAVSISTKHEGMWSNSQSGVGWQSGGKFYLTNKIETLRWIHVADPGVHSVDVFRTIGDVTAAAKAFRVYRIKGDLPAIRAGSERLHGIHTERCYDTSGIGMNFGIGQHKTREEREEEAKQYSAQQRAVRHLKFLQDTVERYTQYLKFTGQNTIIMGVYQYTEDNTPFMHPYEYETARIIPSMKTMLANTLEVNGLTFFAGVEWSQTRHVSLNTFANNAQVAKGADTYWMVDANGRQRYGCTGSTIVPNWAHPAVAPLYKELFAEVAEKFGHLSAFKGVNGFVVATPEAGYYPPLLASDKEHPFAYSYDDQTFRQFEQDSGLKLPIDANDPQRFAKRAQAIQNPTLKKRFVTWRCQKYRDFLAAGLAGLREKRKDLIFPNVLGGDDHEFFKYWLASGREYKDLLRDFAVDLELLNKTDGIGIGRWTISWRDRAAPQNPYFWLAKVDPRITSAYDTGAIRYVIARTSWDEGAFVSPGYTTDYRAAAKLVESDWIMDWTRTRTLPQPSGYHAREAMMQALICNDTNVLIYGFTDLNINVGHEQEIREVMQIVTHLPKERFQPVLGTGFQTNFAIRQLSKGGKSYFYVANPGYWHIAGTVTLSGGAKVYDLVSGKEIAVERQAGKTVVPVSLAPFGLAAYRVDAANLKIESYRTNNSPAQELAYMEDIIQRVENLISDREIKLVLSLEDRAFMEDKLRNAKQALTEKDYAHAWSVLTDTQFWAFWKDFLEKAAAGLALLPASVAKETPPQKGGLRELAALPTSQPIRVDGKLDESAWTAAKFSVGFVNAEGLPALAETGVKALYDSQNLYLGFICADKDPRSLKVTAQGASDIWPSRDDVLAIFIQPDESVPLYYQLAFNSKGTQFHQKVVGGEPNYAPLAGWKPAVSVGDKYWTAEVVLPNETLGLKKRGTGNWRINFHRVYRDNLVDRMSWSLSRRNWHSPDRFGRLLFAKS